MTRLEGTWDVRRCGCHLNQVCMCCVAGARFETPDPPMPGASGLCLGEALEQLVTVLQQAPLLPPPPDHATTCLLLQWLQVRFILHSSRPCYRISVSFVCYVAPCQCVCFEIMEGGIRWSRETAVTEILDWTDVSDSAIYMDCRFMYDLVSVKCEISKYMNVFKVTGFWDRWRCDVSNDIGGLWMYLFPGIDDIRDTRW